MEKVISKLEIDTLRDKGIINNQEIAIKIGDLLVAENVVSRARRVISEGLSVLEETKKLLKG
jgi:hypothetical protein